MNGMDDKQLGETVAQALELVADTLGLTGQVSVGILDESKSTDDEKKEAKEVSVAYLAAMDITITSLRKAARTYRDNGFEKVQNHIKVQLASLEKSIVNKDTPEGAFVNMVKEAARNAGATVLEDKETPDGEAAEAVVQRVFAPSLKQYNPKPLAYGRSRQGHAWGLFEGQDGSYPVLVACLGDAHNTPLTDIFHHRQDAENYIQTDFDQSLSQDALEEASANPGKSHRTIN